VSSACHRRKLVLAVVAASSAAFAGLALARAGDLDPNFGTGGKVTTPFVGGDAFAVAVALQADGKIVAAGHAAEGLGLARYSADGTLDPTFGSDGTVTAGGGRASDIAIQSDGKIVVARAERHSGATRFDFGVTRFDADGRLDATFGRSGSATTAFGRRASVSAQGVAVQRDGRIVVFGEAWVGGEEPAFVGARYNRNGRLDTSFSRDGRVMTLLGSEFPPLDGAVDVAIQVDGKIVVAGGAFGLARYNANGTLDRSFGRRGTVGPDFDALYDDQVFEVAIQRDRKIVVAGSDVEEGYDYYFSSFALERYNRNGSRDRSFKRDGTVRTTFTEPQSFAFALAIQADGKLVVAGTTGDEETGDSKFALARYNANGTLDDSFGTGGRLETDFASGSADWASDVAIQADGAIVAAGSVGRRFAVARYLAR
jgi:uncharacterized delta-60 repeat protein